jgi:nitrite reductase/ring-hydroxylating ferredoxin subunit
MLMCAVLGRHRAGYKERPAVRIVASGESGTVIHVGALAEIFGQGDRAVLRLERDGRPTEELLLLRRGRRVFALVNRCPHMERPLDDARVAAGVLYCPGHGRSYSLRTGRAAGMLAGRGGPSAGTSALRTARAWAEGTQLFLDIGELGA